MQERDRYKKGIQMDEKRIYFRAKIPYDRDEIEKNARNELKQNLFSLKSITGKRWISGSIAGALILGALEGRGLFRQTPQTLSIVLNIVIIIGSGPLIHMAFFGAAYLKLMSMVKKNLDRLDRESPAEGRTVWMEFYEDLLILRAPQTEEISYKGIRSVREEEDAYVIILKNGREISVKKKNFTEGIPEQFPGFIERAVELSGRNREETEEKGQEESFSHNWIFRGKTVFSEEVYVSREAVTQKFLKKKKRSRLAKYGLPVGTLLFIIITVLGTLGFSMKGLEIIVYGGGTAVVLEMGVMYLGWLSDRKKEKKEIRKAAKKDWEDLKALRKKKGEDTGEPVVISMEFQENEFLVKDGSTVLHMDYGCVRNLYETEKYLFLDSFDLIGMELVEKSGIEGGSPEELKAFLERKCKGVFTGFDLP